MGNSEYSNVVSGIGISIRNCFTGILSLVVVAAVAQSADPAWPRTIETPKGTVTMYQPQPESLKGNKLTARAAVSYTEKGADPVFGAVWIVATLDTDKDSRTASLESLSVTNVKFPSEEDSVRLGKFKALLEREAPKWKLEISLDRLSASLENAELEKIQSESLNNDPPEILYRDTLSFLVVIDGEPKLQKDEQLGLERVINTPYAIVKKDNKYYLYLSPYWFASSSMTEGWAYEKSPPQSIRALEKKIKTPDSEADKSKEKDKDQDNSIPLIVVSTKPAELIQSKGQVDFTPIQGTALLYMANTDNDIFMDINSQKYYVLLSGRWYQTGQLNLAGPWTYVASDKLPPDFKKIPEGSEKDNVLVSVAGTDAAKDAVAEAQIPQTAKVDRQKASTKVTYDGSPKFEAIEGTSLEYAVNTSSTVLKSGQKYYVVDNGVWFESTSPNGPWAVATARPSDTEKIPATNPAYNVKYVYVYDVTPQYVYMGYTPGYMGCYVYGPTVVYGTGYYYTGWYGPYYYPRPVTYGFAMHYNPWTGWSMGVGYAYGGFHMSVHVGGWWGPPMYRPPYRPPYARYYGGRPVVVHHHHNTNININNGRTNNIYNNRNNVSTRDVNRNGSAGGPRPSTTPSNNVVSDRNGNVYQQKNGQWNERQKNDWKPSQNKDVGGMDQTQRSRDRGTERSGSFQQSNHGGGMGGGRMGGGGGGRRR